MTRLAWAAPGERVFEAGIDRGVLYPTGQPGVPWNGLKSVNVAPDGGEPKAFYVDGFKYMNVASAEDFKATLSAFSSPKEFDLCDGTLALPQGLFATLQPRRSFGFAYRTFIGNDTQGIEHGYKINLVYNALAAPSAQDNSTFGGTPTPVPFSWNITTRPPKVIGFKPTPHFVIDSRATPTRLMGWVEDLLYGTSVDAPQLPTVQDLISLFTYYIDSGYGSGPYGEYEYGTS